MREALGALHQKAQDPQWLRDNNRSAQAIVHRSKEAFYGYEPYNNKVDGLPSWQWKFLEAAGKYKARIALGGNRIGKSIMGAYECWLAITGKHPYREFPAKGKLWICATSYGKIQDINLPKFEMFMPSRYRAQSRYNKQEKIWWIRGDDREWKVQLKSAESGRRAFEGDDIDVMWFDEEMPEEIYTECMIRLIDRRGVWWMTATPVLGTAWLKAKTEDEKIFDVYGSMWNNPYLPVEEIEAAAKDMTEEEKLVRIEGRYLIMGGKPVFDVISLMRTLEELKDRDKHPTGIRGTLLEVT